jgi:hypothetical protein
MTMLMRVNRERSGEPQSDTFSFIMNTAAARRFFPSVSQVIACHPEFSYKKFAHQGL